MNAENFYETPKSNLESESNVELKYAGFWVRVLASIIDTVLILLVTAPLLTVIYGNSYWTPESLVGGVWDVILNYVFPAIVIITFWIYKSATPGKMLMGLRVISLGDDQNLSVGQCVGRYFAYVPAMLPLFLGLFWVAFDKRKQGWHDKLANTAVIRVK